MEILRGRGLLQGACLWVLVLGGLGRFPGAHMRQGGLPDVPWGMALAWLGVVLVLVVVGASVVVWTGPWVGRSRLMAMVTAPPEPVWACLCLWMWPAAWGPPGMVAWGGVLLAMLLPMECRWLAQALPPEAPFPTSYGPRALRRVRWLSLHRILPAWVMARWPVWLAGTLILERMLGVAGLASDFAARVALRDRGGLAIWLLVLAGLWGLGRRREP